LVWQGAQAAKALALAPDNSLLALGSAEGRVLVIELATDSQVASLRTGRTAVEGLAFQHHAQRHEEPDLGPNFLLAAGTAGSSVLIWDLSTGNPIAQCLGSEWEAGKLCFNRDGTLLFAASRGSVQVWDAAMGRHVLTVETRTSFQRDFALSPDEGKLLVAGNDWYRDRLEELELQHGVGTRTLRGLSAPVVKTVVSPDGRWVAGISEQWQLGVWDWPSGRLQHIFEAPIGRSADNSAVAFSADGNWLAAAAGKAAKLWELRTGATGTDWPLPDGLVDALAWQTNGQLRLFRVEAADGGARFGTISMGRIRPIVCRIRDLLSPAWTNAVATLTNFNSSVYGALAADGGRVFVVEGDHVGSDHTNRSVLFVDATTGRLTKSFETETTINASFSLLRSDLAGRWISFCTDDRMQTILVEARNGTVHRALNYPPAALATDLAHMALGAVFSSDEKGKLVSLGAGVTLTAGGPLRPLVSFPSDGGPNQGHMTFDPTGQWLIWGNDDGTVSAANIEGVRQALDKVSLGW
jgi:hypothetical protein